MKVRTRFAPSPTGPLHVGGARTALFNWLLAKKYDGDFILRIEDTDQKRSSLVDELRIEQGLRYLGLDYSERYVQSERLETYESFVNELIERGLAYRVFEGQYSQEELAAMKWSERSKVMKIQHWREAKPFHVEKMLETETPFHVRLKMPRQTNIVCKDYLRGEIRFPTKRLHDPVIFKTNGWPTYHLACVVDDHLMEISHVMRGEEWISSLPIHTVLYDAFDWEPPTFVHLPVILNPVGRGKLSKRKTKSQEGQEVPVSIRDYIIEGYLPQALINYMSLLGWSPGDGLTENMSLETICNLFSLDGLRTSSSRWDIKKLRHFNRYYINTLQPEDFSKEVLSYVDIDYLESYSDRTCRILKETKPLLDDRIFTIKEAVDWTEWLYNPWRTISNYDVNMLLYKDLTFNQVYDILDYAKTLTPENMEQGLRLYSDLYELKPGLVFWPIRVAISGQKVALPLFESISLLGQYSTRSRIEKALKSVEQIISKS